jgi:hypothetical protein
MTINANFSVSISETFSEYLKIFKVLQRIHLIVWYYAICNSLYLLFQSYSPLSVFGK